MEPTIENARKPLDGIQTSVALATMAFVPRTPAQDDKIVTAWQQLPRRVYLDTSTLQIIHDFGEFMSDGGALALTDHQQRVAGLADDVWSLAAIPELNVRGGFQYVVTAAAISEVLDRGVPSYSRWVFDVADTWTELSSAEVFPPPGQEFKHTRYSMISVKDRALLQDALDHRCDAFLTMERRLASTAAFVAHHTGLRILRPTDYWRLLQPFAALYR